MSRKKLLTKLKRELLTAVPVLFERLSDEHPDLCCFGLGTTAIVESIVPLYQCEGHLSDPDDSQKYCPWEWKMGNGAVDLGSAVPRVRTELQELRDASSDDGLATDYISTIINALVDLKKSGAFGTPRRRPFLCFWLIGEYEEWVRKSSKLLNTPNTHAAAIEALG